MAYTLTNAVRPAPPGAANAPARRAPVFRPLAADLLAAIREELIGAGGCDPADAAPAARELMRALCSSLSRPETPEPVFVDLVATYVRMVEYVFGAYRGGAVTIGGRMGDVYDSSCCLLRTLGRYPLRWSRKWDRYATTYARLHELRARLKERESGRAIDGFGGSQETGHEWD